MDYRILFIISISLFTAIAITTIALSPEFLLRLPLLSIEDNQTVTKEQLDGAREILKRCNWNDSEKDKMYEILYKAEKELYLVKDAKNATLSFNKVSMNLMKCARGQEPGPSFVETVFGRIAIAFDIFFGISTIFSWIRHYQKTGKNLL